MTGLFLPLDVNYYHDDEFLQAGPHAELLYVRANCWIKANKTDGKIARAQLALFSVGIPNPKRHAEALVEQQLWVETKTGWTIPAYLKRNPSKAQIDAARDISSEAGLRGAHERWHVPPEGTPNAKCAICIAERMGYPNRIAIGSDSHREDRENTESVPVPVPVPETERTTEKSSSSVLTVVPNQHAPDDDDDPFESVLTLIVEAKTAEYHPAKPRAYRAAVRRNTITEDGDLIQRLLTDGDPPQQIALFILGHGNSTAQERTEQPWCPTTCQCDGTGYIGQSDGNGHTWAQPCPNRAP